MSGARRDLLALFLLSLAVRLATAALIPRPGYMDTAYYAAGAVWLARGGGLTEPFIWNYLDSPAGLPHSGFLYWMPLPSLLAAPSAIFFPGSFFALQVPFALFSALLPPVAFALAWEITGRRRTAWVAGLLVLFSGFFFPYWPLPETFAPFALFGSLALWLAGRWRRGNNDWLLVAGCSLLVGLAHLTRADGILLLPIVALAPLMSSQRHSMQHGIRNTEYVFRIACCVFGYLLVMVPWFIRNLILVGAPLSPAGAKTLWLTTYDDLFCYGCDLSPSSYLAWGWPNILHSKLWALGLNLERFLAEDCLIFLCPFVLIGLYRLRRHPAISLPCIYLLLAYLLHSLAFTFPGPRGGVFHASAAALPALMAAGAEGLEAAVGWAGRRRRWNLRQARGVFSAAAVGLAVALSLYIAAGKLPDWREADQAYQEIGRWMAGHGAQDARVMVANPPAFWYHTGLPAVVVPNGDVETALAAADRYGVGYCVLDRNRPAPLAELYAGTTTHPRLRPLAEWGEEEERVVLFQVER